MILIRDKQPSDHDFIFDAWLKNYQATSYFAKRITKQTFMACHSLLIENILARPSTIGKIAGDADFTIYGFIVAEHIEQNPIVHYLYVRPEYRELGIAKSLIESIGLQTKHFEVSHWTPDLNPIQFKHRQFDYNPYRI